MRLSRPAEGRREDKGGREGEGKVGGGRAEETIGGNGGMRKLGRWGTGIEGRVGKVGRRGSGSGGGRDGGRIGGGE